MTKLEATGSHELRSVRRSLRAILAEHREEAQEVIRQGNLNLAIDQDTLYSFAESNALVRDLDSYIMELFDKPLSDEIDRAYMGAQAGNLTFVGFSSIKELHEFIITNEAVLKGYAQVVVNLMTEGGHDSGVKLIQRGVSLAYVHLYCLGKLAHEGKYSTEDGEEKPLIAPAHIAYKTFMKKSLYALSRRP